MKHIIFFLWIVILTNKIQSVEFNVIGNLTSSNDFGCNTQVIIQCFVDPTTNLALWQVGKPVTSTTVYAAQCTGNSCNINPAVSSLYDFNYDGNSGESNMTIKKVTLAEDGIQYKCDDGSTSLIFNSVVQVPPVEETTHILNTTVSEMAKTTMVTCSTGCVTNRTAQSVTFKWFKIYEDGSVAVYKEATPPSNSDDSPCLNNSDCISNGSAVLSNNFTIIEDTTALKVYFQVHILLDGNFLFSVNTTSTFQPKGGQDSTTNTNPFTNHTIAGTTSAAVSFSTEVGSNATTETVIFSTTANSTVYPSNDIFEMTYFYVITIIVVVVLGAVVVVIFLCKLRNKE